MNKRIESIVIVGGGTAGWMTAAALAKNVGSDCSITLIESEEIGTVGVGEATIPNMATFNARLGIDEKTFMRETKATYKLGIEFSNWGNNGESYIHPFGDFGQDMPNGIPFYHHWIKLNQEDSTEDLFDYSMCVKAAKAKRFSKPLSIPGSPLASLAHAYHLDAGLYAKYLRGFAEALGVTRIEGRVDDVKLEGGGFIESVSVNSKDTVSGDLFIDCSGFKGLLIEGALHTGYEDWSDQLLCNRAVTVPCESVEAPLPYTKATAREAGWQWRIPLQHRTGNGYVFCSKYITDEQAAQALLDNLDGTPLADPRFISFQTGHRNKFWNKNCVAIGLSSGFMEPLESTSIHLIQTAIARLIAFFPDQSFAQVLQDKFNRDTLLEYERIRDFLILHYKATQRDDTEFWRSCRDMPISNYLQQKIDLFQTSGQLHRQDDELFTEASWLAVMHGQNIHANNYHPFIDGIKKDDLRESMLAIKKTIDKCADSLPLHTDYIEKHCKAG